MKKGSNHSFDDRLHQYSMSKIWIWLEHMLDSSAGEFVYIFQDKVDLRRELCLAFQKVKSNYNGII